MRPAASTHSRLEYSYCAVLAAWAGPAHWRLKNNRASKIAERTQGTTTKVVENKRARTKRQLDFMGAGLALDCRSQPGAEYEPTQAAKIMISRKTLATGHTWNEANYKTTIDRGLDESHFCKLFLRENVVLVGQRHSAPCEQSAPGPEQEPVTVEPQDYNYDNENDASYCPNTMPEGEEWANEDGLAAGGLHDQLGEMLEPPTKIAKIFIPYAMRAKKVDMKQLKHCSWKMLTENTPSGEKEDVKSTTFFSVYKRLPSKLSSNMADTLSVPLALLSVLHLANEKGLILQKQDDLKDFSIKGLIKES
ncbi:condensin complex subunit 2 isoform X14 [Leptidea sinapis]|nr:condensin complex subunit 2 isoform X2 [Leptidea sinapis]XP_050666534.1 condensin complex subunit 2 isoform X3 [Leptidea sinapis]XP_050666535.1 condensin complex subunit 2 isoform X4 [Leptidea sinapis]XP_050666536.1 condensin complex subunit 2 isoform X5 [Leptidea sinapis]XP_050666537.1 condensin complex subunit 2 isoform X6 [Leptidea sinapis]XP_050666538.1 condensin complex subunit 2 isoform X7 [Leptidea sinapis]XP_050666539.1 condensin complex subunit 2 isoform X8 [Leptidea sinapis]XP_0